MLHWQRNFSHFHWSHQFWYHVLLLPNMYGCMWWKSCINIKRRSPIREFRIQLQQIAYYLLVYWNWNSSWIKKWESNHIHQMNLFFKYFLYHHFHHFIHWYHHWIFCKRVNVLVNLFYNLSLRLWFKLVNNLASCMGRLEIKTIKKPR